MRAFLSQIVEQISCSENTIIIISSSATWPESECQEASLDIKSERPFFCRITSQAYDNGHAQSVEDELRLASIHAPSLVKAIRTNEALGYLDTANLQSSVLFHMLDDYYHLPFKLRNFTKYRNKYSTN